MKAHVRSMLAAGLVVATLTLGACAQGAAARPTAAPASGGAAGAGAKAPGTYVLNGTVDASSGRVSLQAQDNMKYQPNTLDNVKPGQTVTIEMRNAGATVHNIYAPSLGINAPVRATGGQTANATFTAPNTPGTYQFWCNEPGHAEAGKIGQVTVK